MRSYRRNIRASLTGILMLLISSSVLAENLALKLSEAGDYVELPVAAFENLENATFEAWVKWKERRFQSGPFEFGRELQSLGFNNLNFNRNLQYSVHLNNNRHVVSIPNILRLKQWLHLALVSGKDGMRLYLNGVEFGRSPFNGSFAAIADEQATAYLGKSHWPDREYFKGEIDEVRLWSVARSEEEIAANMFRDLTGQEEGLVAFWDFDSNDVRDGSLNGYDGVAKGNARCVPTEGPTSATLTRPIVLQGSVFDEEGEIVIGSRVRLLRNGRRFPEVLTDSQGFYKIVLMESPGLYTLSATHQNEGSWKTDVVLPKDSEQNINFHMNRDNNINGPIASWDGAGLNAVPIHAYLVNPETNKEELVATTLSGKHGLFEFFNLKPGFYRLRCQTQGRRVPATVGPAGEDKKERRPEERNTGSSGRMFGPPRGGPGSPDQMFGPPRGGPGSFEAGQRSPERGMRPRPGERSPERVRTAGHWFQLSPPPRKGTWKTYNSLNGLADNTVTDITKDAEGNIIFAVGRGIYIHDGSGFSLFEPTAFLNDDTWIAAVFNDSTGALWIGTKGKGVFRYNGTRLDSWTMTDGLPGNDINSFFEDSNKIIWVSGEGGSSRIDGNKAIPLKTNSQITRVKQMAQDLQGRMWAVSEVNVGRLDGEEFVRVLSKHATSITFDESGVLWVGTERDGVYRIDGESQKQFTTKDGLLADSITDIAHDSEGAIWIASNMGVSRYMDGSFVNFTTREGLAGASTVKIFPEADGSIWFGTMQGASHYDPRTFAQYTKDDGLPSDDIRASQRLSNGELWFGTTNGVSKWTNDVTRTFKTPPKLNSISALTVRDMIAEPNGDALWISGNRFGAIRYDGKEMSISALSQNVQKVADMSLGFDNEMFILLENALISHGKYESVDVNSQLSMNFKVLEIPNSFFNGRLAYDPGGAVWISTRNAIYRYDGKKTTKIPTGKAFKNTIITALFSDSPGQLWIGSQDGITYYENGELTPYDKPVESAGKYVQSIFRHSDGTLWFGTYTNGVSFFDGECWSSLDTRDGLSGDKIQTILEDDNGSLWFGSNRGLTRYRRSTTRPKVRIVSVTTPDQKHTDLAIALSLEIDKLATIECRATDHKTVPEKRKFRWRIQETNEPWSQPSNQSSIPWHPSSAGTFTFEVQAIDRDLHYSDVASLEMTVFVPWEHNAWVLAPAITSILALFLFSLAMLYRNYLQRREAALLREQMLEQEREKNTALSKSHKQIEIAVENAETAREEAERANSAKSEFLANMSHEIRTPLNAVLGFAHLLSSQVSGERPKQFIHSITVAGKSLLTLINDILDLSKMEAGKIRVQLAPMSLRLLFAQADELFRIRAGEKDIEFRAKIAEDIPEALLLDEARLRQVLLNLVGNALKFTNEGHIALSAKALFDTVERGRMDLVITVEDTGVGIPEESRERVFQSFEQIQTSEAGGLGGTGLGLPISRRLMKIMNGEITLRSQKEGEGSVFDILLRDVEVSSLPVSLTEELPVDLTRFSFQKQTVLVMDDVKSNRDLLTNLLSDMNLNILLAKDGVEALEMLERHSVDLILMDIRTPRMNGIEATRRIKANPALRSIPVIGLTASSRTRDKEEAERVGFEVCLDKPVNIGELLEEMSKHLRMIETDRKADAPQRPVVSEIDRPSELAKVLREEMTPLWQDLGGAVRTWDIAPFAKKLEELAKAHKAEELTSYAVGLSAALQSFDTEKIEKSLAKFPDRVEAIVKTGEPRNDRK